ncbi:MAG TPA: HEAT repeat domain-containing protein [Polyangiaceae bacterium]|nr:HEAT repeat domain-containing protein [Polyangiaceae bacterium]
MRRSRSGISFLASLSLLAAGARGAPSSGPAIARAGGGQPALAVGFDAAGKLRARVCAADPCGIDGATEISVPSELAALVPKAVLRVVRLGMERKAVVVEVVDASKGVTWNAVVAAPLSGAEPVVPFAGYTGPVEGIEGERSGPSVLVRDEGVYVGTVREGRDLCGRPALLSPEAIDPATLTRKPAKLMRLSDADRGHATAIVATRAEGDAPGPLLRATWATSAATGTSVAALTDGKADTAWAEGRGGAGRGESAVLQAPDDVPLAGLELEVPAAPAKAAAGAKTAAPSPPKELWVATDRELFRVMLPADAAKSSGSRFAVAFPAPVQTSCVALVVESGFDDAPGETVGLAEVFAKPAAGGSIGELVQRLSAPGPEGDAAASLLTALGAPAFTAVAAAFSPDAEVAGRRSLSVLDEAPCSVAIPPYLAALTGPDALRAHARAALGRCGKDGPEAIARTLRERDAKTRLVLADELVTAAPGVAVDAIVPLLGSASRKERRVYRSALARAAMTPDGAAALERALDRADLVHVAALDVLRAPGTVLAALGEPARRAFSRLAVDGAPFRTRYLLLEPAAELAATDGPSRTFLRQALRKDPSPYVRAEAARSLLDPRPFESELSALLDDPDPRVREAAARSLGEGRLESALGRLTYRFREDTWPMVRSASAEALAALGPNADADDALVHAIDYEESAMVRRSALLAVGARHVVRAAPLARDRVLDRIEAERVRSAAALALGKLCDRESVDVLTEQAVRLVNPNADDIERHVAESALAALSVIRPPDLERRIAVLSRKEAPGAIRRLAALALGAKQRCPAAPGAR